MRDDELLRYSRHILLPDIDFEGQMKITQTRVLIIGLGGLGCPAAMYLAASGVGTLYIVDDDLVEMANLQRQIAYRTEDIGKAKATVMAILLAQMNPHVHVIPLVQRVDLDCLHSLLPSVDLVLDASDNFITRYAVNTACVLHKKPLVSASASGFVGQLAIFKNLDSTDACYACLYQDGLLFEDETSHACTENGVLSPLVGLMGAWQAAETIKWMIGIREFNNQLLIMNAKNNRFKMVKIVKDALCNICGTRQASS